MRKLFLDLRFVKVYNSSIDLELALGSNQAIVYEKWALSKKVGFNLKFPLSNKPILRFHSKEWQEPSVV